MDNWSRVAQVFRGGGYALRRVTSRLATWEGSEMFGKGRRERRQLERSGRRARATVLEIAALGLNIGDAGPDRASSGSDAVRKTTLRVEPEGEPPFEVTKRLRYGHGRFLPKAGDAIEVLYDPKDHEKLMVAPPTAEEERQRTMAALGESNLLSIGSSGGLSGEALEQHQQALAAAQEAQERMQQFMGDPASPAGGTSPQSIALAQLDALRAGGAMTEEEYEAAKARLEDGD
jgi:hypothetical protein